MRLGMQSHQSTGQSGFSIIEVLLFVLVLAALAVTSLVVYQHYTTTSTKSAANTGQPQKTSQSKSTTNTQPAQPTTNYLTIKEWGVQAPYSGTDTLTYSIAAGDPNTAWITSQRLANADPNCAVDGNAGNIGRYLPTDNFSLDSSYPQTVQDFLSQDFKADNSQPPAYAKVGKYYYLSGHGPAGCATTPSAVAVENLTERAVDDLLRHFQAVSR